MTTPATDLRESIEKLVDSLVAKHGAHHPEGRRAIRYAFSVPVRLHKSKETGLVVHVGFTPVIGRGVTIAMQVVYSQATLPGMFKTGGEFRFE